MHQEPHRNLLHLDTQQRMYTGSQGRFDPLGGLYIGHVEPCRDGDTVILPHSLVCGRLGVGSGQIGAEFDEQGVELDKACLVGRSERDDGLVDPSRCTLSSILVLPSRYFACSDTDAEKGRNEGWKERRPTIMIYQPILWPQLHPRPSHHTLVDQLVTALPGQGGDEGHGIFVDPCRAQVYPAAREGIDRVRLASYLQPHQISRTPHIARDEVQAHPVPRLEHQHRLACFMDGPGGRQARKAGTNHYNVVGVRRGWAMHGGCG